jgi:hypothetical protein
MLTFNSVGPRSRSSKRLTTSISSAALNACSRIAAAARISAAAFPHVRFRRKHSTASLVAADRADVVASRTLRQRSLNAAAKIGVLSQDRSVRSLIPLFVAAAAIVGSVSSAARASSILRGNFDPPGMGFILLRKNGDGRQPPAIIPAEGWAKRRSAAPRGIIIVAA